MDLTTQKERYFAMSSAINDYAVAARAGRTSGSVTVDLTSVQVAECLISLGHVASLLADCLTIPGNDGNPVIQDGLRQLDDVLDAMAVIQQASLRTSGNLSAA